MSHDLINQFDFEHKGRKFLARVYHDYEHRHPWQEEDGHGVIREGRTNHEGYAAKKPGERVIGDTRIYESVWLYDFAETLKIAKRDGWGVSSYRDSVERGANGLVKVTSQYFDAENRLSTFASDWCDDINEAYRQVHQAHKASMTPRAYVALAVQQDMERMDSWLRGKWCYVGVSVTERPDYRAAIEALEEAQGSGDELDYAIETLQEAQDSDPEETFDHALWGIESDAGDYIKQVAIELADEIIG